MQNKTLAPNEELVHLDTLKPEWRHALDKFKEYDARVDMPGFNRASYKELVHDVKNYSDTVINTRIIELRKRRNELEAAEVDEGDVVDDTVFYTYNRLGDKIIFTVNDCINFLVGVRAVRNYYAKREELEKLDAEIAKAEKATLSRQEVNVLKLQELKAKRDGILGIKQPVAETTEPSAESVVTS